MSEFVELCKTFDSLSVPYEVYLESELQGAEFHVITPFQVFVFIDHKFSHLLSRNVSQVFRAASGTSISFLKPQGAICTCTRPSCLGGCTKAQP